MIKQSKPLQTKYDTTHIYDRYYIRTHVYVFLFSVKKNACLNYREFDPEGDLVGVPHTWYLSAQSFIRLLKLVWREYDTVAMNEWKKKCVGLQRTWVSKRTVHICQMYRRLYLVPLMGQCFFLVRHRIGLCCRVGKRSILCGLRQFNWA